MSSRRSWLLISLSAINLLVVLAIAFSAGGCAVDQPVDNAALATPIPALTPVPLTIWTTTGRLRAARSSRMATPLADGAALVAGGSEDEAASEIYDPAMGAWTSTGLR